MVRMRKDKNAPISKSSEAPKATRTSAVRMDAKQQAKGSDAIELVTGNQDADPSLMKDVSTFLSGLKLDGRKDDAAESAPASSRKKPKGRGKASDTASKKVGQPKSGKDQSHEKREKKDSHSVPSASTVQPKAQLPRPPLAVPEPGKSSKRAKFTFDPTPAWYSALLPLPTLSAPPAAPTPVQLASLTSRAAELLAADAQLYASSSHSTSNSAADAHFLQTILSQGTLSDRLSALTLLVQGSPVHNCRALEGLRTMMDKGRKGREEGLKALRCVVDWWVGGGAPDRKLKYFRDQPLLHPDVTDAHLLVWYFEDWLKKYFFGVLGVLEAYSLDPLPYVRTQTLAFLTTLLREKPEQEQNLLRLLVNKLGDTEKAVCSRASYHLLQVLQSHPGMKAVIVREVKALIFRPVASSAAAASASASAAKKEHTHIKFAEEDEDAKKNKGAIKSKGKGKGKKGEKDDAPKPLEQWNSHAWYYAAVTLNQIVLTPSETDRAVARSLIGMYFEMFEEVLGAGRGGEGKHVEVAARKDGEEEKHGNKKGKGKDREKEVKGAAGFAEVEDATSRLLSAVLTGVNRALPFAKVDVASDEVFKTHIDTLFLITHTSTFNISLQALVLIHQITASLTSSTKPSASTSTSDAAPASASFATSLADRFYRTLYASLADARLATSNKQAMYLNLLFKALRGDAHAERVRAVVRRFVQVLAVGIGGAGGAEFVAGGLYLLGELFQTTPALRSLLGERGRKRGEDPPEEEYDPRKRDPQFAHASASPMYELLPLLHHYHPAIALHARQLLAGQPITAAPDLALNTLAHFLDRFVYKNPKKPRTRGASAMQPAATPADGVGVKMSRGEVLGGAAAMGGVGGKVERVNEEGWWRGRREVEVPVDEVFFHRYFTRRSERDEERKAKVGRRMGRGEDGSDESEDEDEEGEDVSGEESEGEDEKSKKHAAGEEEGEGESGEEDSDEEAEIWKAMKATMPVELEDDDLMDDSGSSGDEDEIPSGLDDMSELDDADSAAGDAASADGAEVEGEDMHEVNEEGGDDDDVFSLAEASDAEDLLPLDADVPMQGLIEYDGPGAFATEDDERAEWGGISEAGSKKKRKRGEEKEKEGGKGRRKKLRSLPTFASWEEYAALIEDGPEDNI